MTTIEVGTVGASVSVASHMFASTGLIIPPPEIRAIVDKTALFVAKNGREFEERVRENDSTVGKFSFLFDTNHYHGYYLKKLKDYIEEHKEGGAVEGTPAKNPLLGTGSPGMLNIATLSVMKSPIATTPSVKPPPKEPSTPEFILNFPPMTLHDLSILKLTAYFVARNGRNFLAGLLQKEGRNFQFEFLKPHHSLFSFFTRLVEQYTKILLPSKDMKKTLELRTEDPFVTMERISSLTEWDQYQESERKKAESEAEKERLAFAALDWENFTVVETIHFLPSDAYLDLPAPITLNELKARSLADKPAAQLHEKQKQTPEEEEATEMEMDEEKTRSAAPAAASSTEAHVVLSELSAPIKVRKDYVPKVYAAQRKPIDEFQICPNCNQSIPRDELANHLRIELLDPKWREQRQALLDRLKTDDVQAAVDVAGALKAMAKHRADIFAEEEESQQQRLQKEDRMKRLEASLTLDQGGTHHPSSGSGTQFEPVSYVPEISSLPTPPFMPHLMTGSFHSHHPSPPPPPSSMPYTPSSLPTRPPTFDMTTHSSSYFTMQTPSMPTPSPPSASFGVTAAENNVKRPKLDDESSLMPEDEFLSIHQGPITVLVQVPDMPDKVPSFVGQTLELSLDLTSTVASLKNELQSQLEVLISKQKLKSVSSQLFLKDTNTLAYYNLTDRSPLQLGLRERGGRK